MQGWMAAIGLSMLATHAMAQPALTEPVSNAAAELGPFKLKLPAGSWQEVKQVDQQQVKVAGGGTEQTPTSRRLYVQMQDGRVAATLIVAGSDLETQYGWQPPRLCFRKDIYWSDDRNGWTQNYDCAAVNHVVLRESGKTSDLMRAAFDVARANGGMPRQMVYAQFADARSKHTVSVTVAFNPELAGLPPSRASWKNSEWQASRADAAHKAYLDRVVAWASSYRTVVRDALP